MVTGSDIDARALPEWHAIDYEGFEIHAAALAVAPASTTRFSYLGYVCHPGADPPVHAHAPKHAVAFHPEGDVEFASAEAALDEAWQIGRSIVEGTHPDLTVLPLVTGGV